MAGKSNQKPVTVLGHCVKVLQAGDGPMKAVDIIKAVLGKVTLKGKTPNTTVAKILSVEAAKDSGKIVRLGHGLYELRDRAIASGEMTAGDATDSTRKEGESASPIAGAVVIKDGNEVKPDPKPASSRRRSSRQKEAANA